MGHKLTLVLEAVGSPNHPTPSGTNVRQPYAVVVEALRTKMPCLRGDRAGNKPGFLGSLFPLDTYRNRGKWASEYVCLHLQRLGSPRDDTSGWSILPAWLLSRLQ